MWPLSAQEIYEILTSKTCSKKDYESLLITGACTDSRKIRAGHIFIAIQGEKFDGHSFIDECFLKGASLALVCKDSPFLEKLDLIQKEKCIEVDDVLAAYRKLSKYMRQRFPFPVIGIGGSNGKTTTKEMLVSLLSGDAYKVTKTEKSENGFLGMALTICQESHNISSTPHALILEIGIDDINAMQEHINLSKPDISVLTALGPEHLEHLKDWNIAAQEELILFKNKDTKRVWQFSDEKILTEYKENFINNLFSVKKDYIVSEKSQFTQINNENPLFFTSVEAVVVWQLVNEASTYSEIKLEIYKNGVDSFLKKELNFKIPLPGKHNARNFALSFATACMINRTPREIEVGWKNFVPPPMRSRIVTLKNGAVLYDDSYNASPMSIEAALNVLENKDWEKRPKFVVLGDMLDLGEESKYWHEHLFNSLKKLRQTHLCFYGNAMYNCYKLMKDIEDLILKKNKTQIFWLPKDKNPIEFFSRIKGNSGEYVILIKGSRGMELDRLVHELEVKNFLR